MSLQENSVAGKVRAALDRLGWNTDYDDVIRAVGPQNMAASEWNGREWVYHREERALTRKEVSAIKSLAIRKGWAPKDFKRKRPLTQMELLTEIHGDLRKIREMLEIIIPAANGAGNG